MPTGAISGIRDVFTSPLSCLFSVSINDAVYISGIDTIALANASSGATSPALGIVVSKPNPTTCIVQIAGTFEGLSGLITGAVYYLDTTDGQLTVTPPAGPDDTVQIMGQAIDAQTLIMGQLGGGGGGGGGNFVGGPGYAQIIAALGGAMQTTGAGYGSSVPGDERGAGAVDLQVYRDLSSQVASGNYSCVDGGKANTASGYCSHAEGVHTTASGSVSHTEGYATTASYAQAHAEGYATTASDRNSHAEGWRTVANNNEAHAEGKGSQATGTVTHAEGYYTTATGNFGHAEGKQSIASGYASHSESQSTHAEGQASHAEGNQTIAYGFSAHAEGSYTTATGNFGHAEGTHTTAVGNSSHAEGGQTTASGYASHAEGYATTASGRNSHAEGRQTTAYGTYSHAEGGNTTAYAMFSHAGGHSSLADKRAQLARASGQFVTQGDAQFTDAAEFIATADATPTEMTLDGAVASGTSNVFTVPTDVTLTFVVTIIARNSDGSDNASFKRYGVIVNNTGVTALVGAVQTLGADIASAGAVTWSVAVTADATNNALAITVTGAAATTIHWVAKLETVEVG